MLRKAVIACMAAVSGVATTVATGTLFVTMASQHAHAALSVSADGTTVTYDGSGNNALSFSKVATDYPEATTLVFDIVDGRNYLDNTTGFTGLIQIGNYNQEQGLILSDGGSSTYEITNKVVGQGMIKKTGAGTNMTLNFTGDVSEYTGKIVLGASKAFTLQFGKEGVTAICDKDNGASGTGDISFIGSNDTLVYAYAPSDKTIYITNAISNKYRSATGTQTGTSKLKLTGGADYRFTRGLTINEFTMEGGSARFDSGAVYLLNTNVSGGTTITGKATSDGADDTRLLNLTVTGGLTIEGQVSLGGTIRLQEAIVNNGTVILRLDTTGTNMAPLQLDLSGLTAEITGSGKGSTGTYTLFDGGNVIGAKDWADFDLTTLTSDELATYLTGVETVGKEWSFANGKITYTILATDLIWNQASATFSWVEGTEFSGGAKFANDDNVVFAENLGTVTAGIDEDIAVSQLTVNNGTNLVLAGTGALELNKVVFGETAELTIAADREMTWAPVAGTEGTPQALVVQGKLTVENSAFNTTPTITVDGGTLIAKAGGNMYIAGDVIIDNAGTIEVTEGDDLFNWGDANRIDILNGSTLKLNATRNSIQTSDVINLDGGTITGVGASHNGNVVAIDCFENGNINAAKGSVISAPIRIQKAANVLTFNVTEEAADAPGLTVNGEIMGGGAMKKTGAGTLDIAGTLNYTGATTVAEGTLKFSGTTGVASLVVDGGSVAVGSTGAVTPALLSGSGSITVAEGGSLTLGKVEVAAAGLSISGVAIAGDSFAKTGEGTLTLDVLSVAGSFNMNGWDKLALNSVHLAEGAELVYGAGDVLSIGSVTTAVSLNVFGVSNQLAAGFDTGITLGADQDVQALKELLTVDGVDTYELSVDESGHVWLSSTSTIQSDWDINWGAELAKAPSTVPQGGIGTLSSSEHEGSVYYELYGNTTYTVSEGVIAISLTGDGANNAIVVGGNDANADNGVGTVTTDVWIEANEGTYKGIIGGNYAQNWGNNGLRADFVGNTHIKIDGATVGTIVGGNHKDGQSPRFVGDTYISVFSGSVTGSIIGSGTAAHNQQATHTGNTNIFVYTPLTSGESKLNSEPSDMILGGFSWITNVSKGQTLDGNTNILVDTTGYEGDATEFAKHIVGGSHNNTAGTQSVTGSTNIVLDLGDISMKNAYKVIGGNWCNYGSTDIGATNITIKSGTYKAPVVGGSWVGSQGGTHAIESTCINVSGGTLTGSSLFGGSCVANGSPTLTTGDITILLNGDAVVNHVYGGHSIESGDGTPNENMIVAVTDSIEITVDDNAHVMGSIVGGSLLLRNNNSRSSFITGDIVINLNDGQLSGTVYGAGEALGTMKQQVENVTINLSSEILLPGKTISGGYDGEATNAAACTITGSSKLVFTDAVEYGNLTGTQFKDFNAVELTEGATVTMTSFSALNKEVAISGAGTLRIANSSAVELDALTLSGATVTMDNGISSAAGLSLTITQPSKLILPTKVGEQVLTLAALDIDMTGASATKAYVDLSGELTSLGNLAVNLTNVGELDPGEYVLIDADSVDIAGELAATFDAEVPAGMEYVVEVVGNKLIFRSSFLSDWVWEGSTNGEGTVWSDNADGWKANAGSPNGQNVYFTAAAEGTVTVSGEVTPGNIEVSGGEYTFVGEDDNASIKLGADGKLVIGVAATLNMAMDNDELGGTTDLKGKLVLQSDNAMGDSALQFNGGTLVYDTLTDDEGNKTHITTDLSKQSSLAADYEGPIKIEVTDADNTVTWNKATWNEVNPGVDAILNAGIEKTGEGTMNVTYKFGSSTSYAGTFDVQEGTVNMVGSYTAGDAIPQLTFTGGMKVAEGTALNFSFDHQSSDRVMTFAGTMSGTGTITLGGNCGRLMVTGNNSGFAGTLVLQGSGVANGWNRAGFANANAFGGSATKVQVNGRGFFFNGEEHTIASAIEVLGDSAGNLLDGSTKQKLTFTGAWTVAEDAAFGSTSAGPNVSYTVALAGDITGYKGTLRTRSNNTWVLGGAGVAGTGSVDMKEVNGDGKLKVQYSGETLLNTVVAGAVAMQQSGTGKLVLTSENTTTGALTVDAGTQVQLGNAATAGAWAGSSLAGKGSFILTHGALSGLTSKADGATLAVETTKGETSLFAIGAGGGTVVDLTGSDASLLDSIKLVEGSTLIVDDALTVGGAGNTTLDMALTTDNMTSDNTGVAMIQGGNLTIAGAEGVNLNLSNADVLAALNGIGDGDLYLQITDGTLALGDGVNINDVINPNLLGLGLRAQLTTEGAADGYVMINGDVSDVYFTDNQAGSSATTADSVTVTDGLLGIYAATVVNTGDTLTVESDTIIHNLNGQEGGNVIIANGADVSLDNQLLNTGVAGYDPMGADNVLLGNLTGETGSTIAVQGAGGSLTVGGALTADTLSVESGALIANGGAEVANLTVADGATMTVANGLQLQDGSILGELKSAGTAMTVTGQVDVEGQISGMDLTMQSGSVLNLSGDTDDKGVAQLNSLQVTKDATLMGSGAKVTVGATKPSTIAGKLSGTGSLTATDLTLDNATGASGWDVTNNGNMLVDITDSGSITLGQLTLGANSTTTLKFNSDNGMAGLLDLQQLVVDDTAQITLQTIGEGQLEEGKYVLGTVMDGYEGAEELYAVLTGTGFSRIDKTQSYISVVNGEIILNAVKSTDNELSKAATHANARAGADLLWNAAAPVGGDLEAAYNSVDKLIADGNTAAANEAMASVAGSSTAAMGMALSGDVERQLRSIRNRTTTMGVNQCVVNEGMPYFNAWVNAEGNFGEMDKDGLASGYKLDSWGGTVGFDVDVNPNLTLGLALTAMYGDLTVDGPDTLDGDMDTIYVSAFARYSKQAWTHTFIGTIGLMDASYDRTVNYGGKSYTAQGDTDGMAFGLMYEVGRVYSIDEDGDACWQPVFNVAYRHSSVGGYTEKGTDAALKVDDQTLDTITLGAGARVQAVVGENIFNRTSVFEARALAKFDIGDTASEADVALVNGTGHGTVESAELGAFGVELGAGLSVPVGDDNDGTIFFDVSAELRSGYTEFNGTVGYRINF